jgi:hypothetical protein
VAEAAGDHDADQVPAAAGEAHDRRRSASLPSARSPASQWRQRSRCQAAEPERVLEAVVAAPAAGLAGDRAAGLPGDPESGVGGEMRRREKRWMAPISVSIGAPVFAPCRAGPAPRDGAGSAPRSRSQACATGTESEELAGEPRDHAPRDPLGRNRDELRGQRTPEIADGRPPIRHARRRAGRSNCRRPAARITTRGSVRAAPARPGARARLRFVPFALLPHRCPRPLEPRDTRAAPWRSAHPESLRPDASPRVWLSGRPTVDGRRSTVIIETG